MPAARATQTMGKGINGNNNTRSGARIGVPNCHSDYATVNPPPASAPAPRGHFSINLSVLFLLLSFVTSTIIAFSIGWIARVILLTHFGLNPYSISTQQRAADSTALVALPTSAGMSKKVIYDDEFATTMSGKKQTSQLPAPKVIEGKDVPFTTYASKTFQMAGVATSNTLHIDRTSAMIMAKSMKDGGPDFTGQGSAAEDEGEDEGEDEDEGGGVVSDGWVPCNEKTCSRGKERKGAPTDGVDVDGHNDDSEGLHLPAGQHILIDIKDVDSNFLNSEERLARAMIELINESRLTLLSYHCHSLVPIGVSCAGVLLESHVAFHTWPLEGVITIDLFTCGGGLLIPTLPSIERLFGVPGALVEEEYKDEVPKPTMLWSHVLRGFREGFAPGYVRSKNPLDGSLGRYVLGKLDFDVKRPLLSTKTAIQSVNIYEVLEPKTRDVNSYRMSIMGEDGSYEAVHPEHFGPDKILFLDGILQSTMHGDAPYHESIVHPAMIAHSSPKRVAIIGGGEGATLREVLKHRSVQEAVILEIDRELVNICAEYMPEWSDCGDLEGSDAGSCFYDSRVRIMYVDAFQWLLDTFLEKGDRAQGKFDVIIMDALDPNTSVEIAGGLYDDARFVDSLFNGLTEKGVFAVQLGKSKMATDPPDEVGRFRDTALMINGLEQSGFKSIHIYDEGHSHFFMPWSYLVAFKDYKSKAGWFRTSPEIEIELQRRLHKTRSGRPTLRYFDAATMVGYQLPSKAQETVYCRNDERPYECEEVRGIDPETVSIPTADLAVRKSSAGKNAGRGLFAKRDIPQDATLSVDEDRKAFQFLPLTWFVVKELNKWANGNKDKSPFVSDEISGVLRFGNGYGHGATLLGETHFAVDSSVLLMMNHGCNGTYNYGYIYDEDHEIISELNIDLSDSAGFMNHLVNMAENPYCPVFDRNWRRIHSSGDYFLRDVKEGEEILTNYLSFVGTLDDFKEDAISLRGQCSGDELGEISTYELES